MESEYLFLLLAATQNARENHEYLDSTRSSYDRTKCRERKYEGIIMDVNPLLQKPGKKYIEAGKT
jgi:hypothetical protein